MYYCIVVKTKTKKNNYKDTENYTPPLSTDCYSKDVNGNLVVDPSGKFNSTGSYNPGCYCNIHTNDLYNCPPDKLWSIKQ